MKTIAAALCLLLLAGCVSATEFLAGQVPSLAYCDEVTYHRKGNNAKILAECRVPVR